MTSPSVSGLIMSTQIASGVGEGVKVSVAVGDSVDVGSGVLDGMGVDDGTGVSVGSGVCDAVLLAVGVLVEG